MTNIWYLPPFWYQNQKNHENPQADGHQYLNTITLSRIHCQIKFHTIRCFVIYLLKIIHHPCICSGICQVIMFGRLSFFLIIVDFKVSCLQHLPAMKPAFGVLPIAIGTRQWKYHKVSFSYGNSKTYSPRGDLMVMYYDGKATNHGTNPIIYHGPPKPTFLEVFMVNNLVFRWPKPLFFMVWGLMVYTKLTSTSPFWNGKKIFQTSKHPCFPMEFSGMYIITTEL